MVTISCSCGSAATVRTNPVRHLDVAERVALVEAAFGTHDGFLALELDASWHPAGDDPDEGCVVLADLDEIDACVGLDEQDARVLRAALGRTRVAGRLMPPPAFADDLTFRVGPADGFRHQACYVVHDGRETLLEVDADLSPRNLLADLGDLYRRTGRPGLRRVAVSRLALADAIDAAAGRSRATSAA